jgi:hypothetical protein
VIKIAVFFSLAASIILIGLTSPVSPFGPGRNPVPQTQKVAHSSHCSGCHGVDETGLSLVDHDGNDVSIFDDWQISMMGLSARDPFWRATMAHEINLYPSAQQAIETTCLKCHAPLGSFEARRNGNAYTYEMMLGDSLGLDGVSCSACHQQPAAGLGSAFSGNYTLDTNRIMFGHYPNPFKGPMQIYVGFEPEFSDHIYSSGVCASCHTLITETLQPDGTPSGDFFVEQATYHEWLNSSYPAQGKECQSCHMPFINDGVIIASDFAALEERSPYGLHQFFGANTAMLELMRENKDTLNLPVPEGAHAWDESINNNRISLSNAAELSAPSLYVFGDTLYLSLSIKNKTGHKLPSGYPSRLAWIQINLKDQMTQETFYSNGEIDQDGNIVGRDLPFEPHHTVSKSAEDVQIYELVMSDLQGHLTTRLNAAFEPLKDNRLLPAGFRIDHAAYDTVAVWGDAGNDPDYTAESTKGRDRIEYRIPLDGRKSMADLSVTLHYQTLPSRWMADLFTNDTLELVGQFKTMYQGYNRHHEVINQLLIDSIDLSTTSISPVESIAVFTLSPNPATGRAIQIRLSDPYLSKESLHYEIINMHGQSIQAGQLNENIILDPDIKPGVLYFVLFDQKRRVAVKSFVVL